MEELRREISSEKPLIIGIPGLLGGGGDFRAFAEALGDCCQILPFDPHASRTMKTVSKEQMDKIDYQATGPEIIAMVDKEVGPEAKFYALGISIGGKVVYDLAIKYPDRFLGGIVTDVGPGTVIHSTLYDSVIERIKSIDMTLPWPELRENIRSLFPEKTLRVMVQTQVAFNPNRTHATWREGMRNLQSLLVHQSLDDQWDAYAQADPTLAYQGKYITLLHASKLSAIAPGDFEKMRTYDSLKVIEVENAIHFIHVDHQDKVVEAIRSAIAAQEPEEDWYEASVGRGGRQAEPVFT
jgi:pimeloyl-ACP methyl ester carboxylesterase